MNATSTGAIQGYEPGGSLLPGRNYSPNAYRFGAAGGQEKDDEIYGSPGTSYTAEYWQYDPRIARRWNIDPVDNPWMSPYHAFSNKFITNIDPNGANDSPIYDPAAEFMGTDDEGLQGEAIIMDRADFTQNMSHSDAMSKGKTLDNMDNHEALKFANNGLGKLLDNYNELPNRIVVPKR